MFPETKSETTPEKLENLKTHKMGSFHSTPEKFENATITSGRKA